MPTDGPVSEGRRCAIAVVPPLLRDARRGWYLLRRMNIQINGSKKSSDTRKAIRFFSDRNIPHHVRDVFEKPLSSGELENISRSIDPDDLIDREGKRFRERGLAHFVFTPVDEIIDDPAILRLPIVRNGSNATVGYEPDVWKGWIEKDKR